MSTTQTPPTYTTVKEHASSLHEVTEVWIGEKVLQLMEDAPFIEQWDHLLEICPWATLFQSHCYVATWYRHYSKEYLPIVIKRERGGMLTGLFTLAQHKNGLITGAGNRIAEYQCWLTADAHDDRFIREALQEIGQRFPGKRVNLKYLPAGIPLDWIKKHASWNRRCILRTFRHPLMIINDEALTKELKKKNRKEKLNRLKRLGDVKFERVIDYKEFASIIDEISLMSDFRKGFLYDKLPFKEDPPRKAFYLSLFEQGYLHVTVLKLNDSIIASNVSVRAKNGLCLQGINSHAPAYSRYSPGIIHFLLLGKLMAEEGRPVFDLTPGGDSYKDMLATDYITAYTLSVGDYKYIVKARLKSKMSRYVKIMAGITGKKPDELVKTIKNSAGLLRPGKIKRKLAAMVAGLMGRRKQPVVKSARCWMAPLMDKACTDDLPSIQKDSLQDLVDFDPREKQCSRKTFLAAAGERIEAGEHCYTWAEGGTLLACVWVSKADGMFHSLAGLYCHAKGRERLPDFIKSVAAELSATASSSCEKLYIVTDCGEETAFEKAGFQKIDVVRVKQQ